MTRTLALAAASLAALAACTVTTPPQQPPPQQPPAQQRPAPADGLMVWPNLLERERPQESASIRYGEAELQVVDLWLPAGKGPHPTVLMVHGGCWQSEIADRRIMNWIADDLRKRGIAVWNIDYRGVDREGGGYPGTFLDAAAAADALAEHRARYNLDLTRLVAVGHSAGGHLALWLAARDGARERHDNTVVVRTRSDAERAPQEAAQFRRIEQTVRGLEGKPHFIEAVRQGESAFYVRFPTREAARDGAAALKREVDSLGLANTTVLGPFGNIPGGSPLLAGKPIPIRTVISLGGLPDLELAATPPGSGCGTEIIGKLVGPPTLSSRDVYADTSIPRLAPLGVSQVLVNGLQDRIIPTSYAETYAAHMRAAGDKVAVRMIDRTGHVELIAPESAAWAATVEEIEKALRRR